jgi:GNAT superfamily N-acetyltransferase
MRLVVFPMKIRPLTSADSRWVEEWVTAHFETPLVVSRGKVHDSRSLPGLVAEMDEVPVGVLLYRIERGQCEVVVLIIEPQRQGTGRKLMAAMREAAFRAGCKRLWLVTTNDNRAAIAFYRSVGMRQVAVRRGAMEKARKLKPEIPTHNQEGIPITDEHEFEQDLVAG